MIVYSSEKKKDVQEISLFSLWLSFIAITIYYT